MRKLMRTIALTIACVLVFGMVAMAAGSTSTTTTGTGDTKVAKDGIGIAGTLQAPEGVKVFPLNAAWLARAQAYADTRDELGKVLTIFDLRATVTNFDFTVSFDELEAGKNYVYIHYYGENWETDYDPSKWEIISAVVDGKNITAHANSTSPWAIVEATGTVATAVVAPKTGEVIAISAILAMLMMAGAVVCAKKARLQK